MNAKLGLKLKQEYQDLADEWEDLYGDGSCRCSTCGMPPCGYCETAGGHPGHPGALSDNPDAWEDPLITAVRHFSGRD